MKTQYNTGRHLNETRGRLGLNDLDFSLIGLAFVGCASLISNSRAIVLALPVPLGLVLILRPIRMKYRRHIVRDFISDSLRRFYELLVRH